jgi:hypothetical protein
MQNNNKLFSSFFLAFVSISLISSPAFSAEKRPIIDGTLVSATKYPYVALVNAGESICTGTLISPNHVLTAAHCFFDENNQKMSDLSAITIVLNNEVYQTTRLTVHPTYVPRSSACIEGETDAAILELNTSASSITPIEIQRAVPQAGTELLLVGFGTQGTGAKGEDDTLPEEGFVNEGYTILEGVTDSYVNWTFDKDRNESNTASGDSGGPAFEFVNGTPVLNSITCGGTGNAGFGTTSDNTRADLLGAWADAVVGNAPGGTKPAFIKLAPQTIGKGQTFSYELQATGSGTISFAAAKLPKGLTLKGSTISGKPRVVGRFSTKITASSAFGRATGTMQFIVTDFNPASALSIDSVVVNFYDEDVELLTIKGKVTLGKSFGPNKAPVKVTVAHLKNSFKLNSNGSANVRGGFDFFKLIGKLNGGKFTSTRVSFSTGLGDSETLYDKLATLFPEEAADGETAPLPIEVNINGVTYSRTVQLKYNGETGEWRSGR